MIRKIGLSLLLILSVFVLGVIGFIRFSPQFGAPPKTEEHDRIRNSSNYEGGQFVNQVETRMEMGFSKMLAAIREYRDARNITPKDSLPVRFSEQPVTLRSMDADTSVFVTWFGHSAVLVELEGKRILLDPMLGEASSPLPFISTRFPYQEPIDMAQFTDIDAVVISHDHYDHLDYPTILQIQDDVGHFFTALGVGSHLKSWGVPEEKITELDWWESAELDNLTFTATPNRHFSGRGLTDRNKTQWASWVLTGEHNNLFFSGDGGYAGHFKEIGEAYGPFDLTMIECGQYNEKWSEIHMMPEQSVQAHLDLKGTLMMPIHWGAFNLAIHSWTDPVLRAKAEAEKHDVSITHPYIGERFRLGDPVPVVDWWEEDAR
ncbi:MAG: MBL fold metallo-hydrolase [Bacteroidota bacterium]